MSALGKTSEAIRRLMGLKAKTAIMMGTGKAAENGILIKSGIALFGTFEFGA